MPPIPLWSHPSLPLPLPMTDPASPRPVIILVEPQLAENIGITARAMGAYFHLSGVPAAVRNDLMSRRRSDDYSMIDWLYGHRA